MTKQTGLGDNLYVGGYDLSGDIGSLSSVTGSVALIDQTSIDKSALVRKGGLRSGEISFTSFWNTTAGQAQPVLGALPTSNVEVMYCRGTTLGNVAACLRGRQIGYDPNRTADGGLTVATQVLSDGYGLEWGELLTAGLRTDAGATNGSSLDGAAGTSFGLQAYLQVTSFTGTDVTIKIQESSDDGAGDAWADVTGGAFTEVTSAPTTERIATSASLTVERYLRVITETTGGFSELTFAVTVVRNDTAVSF